MLENPWILQTRLAWHKTGQFYGIWYRDQIETFLWKPENTLGGEKEKFNITTDWYGNQGMQSENIWYTA